MNFQHSFPMLEFFNRCNSCSDHQYRYRNAVNFYLDLFVRICCRPRPSLEAVQCFTRRCKPNSFRNACKLPATIYFSEREQDVIRCGRDFVDLVSRLRARVSKQSHCSAYIALALCGNPYLPMPFFPVKVWNLVRININTAFGNRSFI